MKDNLEKAFKDSLEGFEVPYDAAAWTAMSAKLDAAQGVGSPSAGKSMLKWWVTGLTIGAAAVAAIFLLPKNDANNTTIVQTELTETQTEKEVETRNEVRDETQQTEKSTHLNEKTSNDDVALSEVAEEGEPAVQNKTDKTDKTKHPELNSAAAENTIVETSIPETAPAEKLPQFGVGVLNKSVVCEGEVVLVQNKNAQKMVHWFIQEENDGGVYGILEAGETMTYQPKADFLVQFKDEEGNVLDETKIRVNALPKPDFNVEANVFDKGLPIVVCEAYGSFVDYEWSFAEEAKTKGSQTVHHFFDKGVYDIGLKVADENGCVGTITKSVSIHEKYNLMAVDAFKPNGMVHRNRTFMPYSLTERAVKFQLTIIDPISNEVVFESTDASNAWDGMNQRTGKMTDSEKAYIWKVQIFNPLPNERPIYSGTVVHD